LGQIMSLAAAVAVGASGVYGYLALTDFPRPGLCPSEVHEGAAEIVTTPTKATTGGTAPRSSAPASPIESTLPGTSGAIGGSADGTTP